MPKFSKRDFPGFTGRLVHYWPKANGRDIIVVSTWKHYGRRVVDIRCWYLDYEGDRRPGKGVRLYSDELPHFRKAARLLKALI